MGRPDARDPVGLAAGLIRTPGLAGQEERVADQVAQVMQGFKFRDIHRDEYGSVVGLVGPDTSRVRLLFDCHMDVVPVFGNWTVDAHGGRVVGGRLYGRGATDNKGALAALLCGLAQAAESGRLTGAVAIAATVMEEAIEGAALGAVLDRLHPEAVVVCEPTDLQVCTVQLGRVEVLLTVYGVPAHAAYPKKGANGIELAAEALRSLGRIRLPSDATLGKAILVATEIASEPYPSISCMPAAVRIRFDRRTIVGEDLGAVLGELDTCLVKAIGGSSFSLEVPCGEVRSYTGRVVSPLRVLPAWSLASTDPLVLSALSAASMVGGSPTPGIFPACSNASESAGVRGIPSIIMGPGRLSEAHAVDESVPVEQLHQAVQWFRQLSLSWA